ncbi:MAG: trypsin-like peptidase domain-containing protein [Planctomycetaceae bacterium]|nr:trypsin-like peptidase domain-containing protein [Planctomycetaceae bacterium]
MTDGARQVPAVWQRAILIVLVLLITIPTRGDIGNLHDVSVELQPSLVSIRVDKRLASGFVVDASGLVATTYNAIAGAQSAIVHFPADHDPRTFKKTYQVRGFAAAAPEINLVILRIASGDKKLHAVTLAKKLPQRRERVYYFSAVEDGWAGSDSWVASVAKGQELGISLDRAGYGWIAHNDRALKATWIAFPAGLSAHSGGGPLANDKGEVVGMAAWRGEESEALALSSVDVARVVSLAGNGTKPLTDLGDIGRSLGDRSVRASIVTGVRPSVVELRMKKRGQDALAMGVVADATGLVVTTYRAIEGAEKVSVVLSDDNGGALTVDGWVASNPLQDLVILKVNPGERRLHALPIADREPAVGEKVLVMGRAVHDGTVGAIWPGRAVSKFLDGINGAGFYQNTMGFGLNAQWIEVTAPFSSSTGGPLVNVRGQLAGIASWRYQAADGRSLNFCVSSQHLRELLREVRAKAMPLSDLPSPEVKGGR